MKKRLLAYVAVLGMLFSLPTLALEKTGNKEILLYATPTSKTLEEKLPGDAALIPIYREKDWVKVGDPRNGKVGWVNRKQLREARQAFYRPDIQTIYIHTDRNAKGKPELNIVAYKNGEKLSPEQAKHMYEKIRKQQMHEMKLMHASFYREMKSMEQVFNTMPMYQPMFVLPAVSNKESSTH